MDLLVAGGGLPGLGNLVLTSLRVRVHDSRYLRFPLTPGRHLRGVVACRCRVGRVPFVVAGSHLSLDAAERVSQATLLKKYLAEVQAEADVPVIFGGDLNENSGGAAWRTIADGLTDAAVAAGRAGVATFPSVRPRERFDAVFLDPRCTVLDYRVVDTPQARAASDHLPVVVDVELPPAGSGAQ
jgi:endonuclease/exonuclease/phosphatase family metal-dependent hydrolase